MDSLLKVKSLYSHTNISSEIIHILQTHTDVHIYIYILFTHYVKLHIVLIYDTVLILDNAVKRFSIQIGTLI